MRADTPSPITRRAALAAMGTVRHQPRFWILPSLIGSALGVAAAFLLVNPSAQEPNRASPISAAQEFFSRNPLPGGVRNSLTDGIEAVGFDAQLPEDDAASDASVLKVWTRGPDLPTILIDYESGIRLTERPADSFDPVDLYTGVIKDGVPGVLSTVAGVPAMMIEREGGSPASVDFILNGIRYSFIGHGGQEADELVKVAETIPTSVREQRV
jgi:hypothetical protein